MNTDHYGIENHMVDLEYELSTAAPREEPDCMDAGKASLERDVPAFTTVAATDPLIRALEAGMGVLPAEHGTELAALRVQLMCAARNARAA